MRWLMSDDEGPSPPSCQCRLRLSRRRPAALGGRGGVHVQFGLIPSASHLARLPITFKCMFRLVGSHIASYSGNLHQSGYGNMFNPESFAYTSSFAFTLSVAFKSISAAAYKIHGSPQPESNHQYQYHICERRTDPLSYTNPLELCAYDFDIILLSHIPNIKIRFTI